MRKYQIVKKPIATASGEPGEWSFVAHGAVYRDSEGRYIEAQLKLNGYVTRRLAI